MTPVFVVAVWMLGSACLVMSIAVRYRRSGPAAVPWNLAGALLFTASVPLSALTGIWPDVGLGAFIGVSMGLWWWFELRRARRAEREPGREPPS